MKEKKKKSGMLVLVLACILGGIVGGIYAIFIMPYFEAHGISVIFELIFLALAFYLQTIIHEGGHLIFGLLTGYKFSSFRIFNIMLIKADGKLKLKKVHISGTGGQCLMSPPKNRERPSFVLYNLGGCFLNIIFTCIFAIAAVFSYELPYLMGFSVCMVICGVIFALLNGLPLLTDSMPNDGYNTHLMSKDKSAVKALWLQLDINRQISYGKRLSEMPKEWFVLPSDEEMKNPLFAAIAVFRANRLVDEHKFGEAHELITNLLKGDSGIIGLHKNLLKCDLVYLSILDGRRDAAAELLTKELLTFMRSMKSFPSVIRVNYTIALSNNRPDDPPSLYIDKFEKAAKSYPYPADIASERELMEIANNSLH